MKDGWLKRFWCRLNHTPSLWRREVNAFNPNQQRIVCLECGTVHAQTR